MHCGATAVMAIARLALTRSIHTANVSTIKCAGWCRHSRLVSSPCYINRHSGLPRMRRGRRPPSLDRPPWSPIHHPCNGIRRHRPSRSLRQCDGSHRAARVPVLRAVVSYAMPRPLWGGHPSRMTDSHPGGAQPQSCLMRAEHGNPVLVRHASVWVAVSRR